MTLTGGTEVLGDKLFFTILTIINLERTGPGSNPDQRGESSVTNSMSHSTAESEPEVNLNYT